MNTLRGFLSEKEENQLEKQQELDEISGEDFVGAVCQISRAENKDSFMGRIESYNEEYNELKISAYRAEFIPVRVEYNSPVKIQIKNGEQLTLIYGDAKKQSKEFWWVTLDHVETYSEQREGFRQPLNGMGTVIRRVDGKQEIITCKLVDISLTGICIACQKDLKIGEKIGVHEIRLYPDSPDVHIFDCEVRRAFIRGKDNEIINLGQGDSQISEDMQESSGAEKRKPQEKYYGCSFLYISSEEKEQLCKEIFFAQQQQRKGY